MDGGTLGPEFEKRELDSLGEQIKKAEEDAVEEVQGSYRFVSLYDPQADNRLKTIDLGAGYANGNESLTGRVISALKQNGLLSESVGAGYIERNWPPAFKDTGAWPLRGLRQNFLDGSLTRLLDPDSVLKQRLVEFVETGEFGLASGQEGQGNFNRIWYQERPSADDVTFDSGTFLLTKAKAEQLRTPTVEPTPEPDPIWDLPTPPQPEPNPVPGGNQPGPEDPSEGDPQIAGDRTHGALEFNRDQGPAQAEGWGGDEPLREPVRSGRLRQAAGTRARGQAGFV